MKQRIIITELTDKDFGGSAAPLNVSQFRVRTAARGVLVREDTIALINITKNNYHKLPGGGIESGETPEEGFVREIKEETGADCEIIDEAGITIEYRNEHKLLQISYVFFAKVVGTPGEVQFEQDEINEGAKLEWTPVKEVQNILNTDDPNSEYEDKFIHKRDLAILEHYKDKLIQFQPDEE